jgi:hypothetical protein
MRLKYLGAIAAITIVPLLSMAPASPASAQTTTPPTGICLTFTNDSGQGFSITNNGHATQATTVHEAACWDAVNPDTISGVTYFQLENTASGLCLNEGISGKVYSESCPDDSTNELIELVGGVNDTQLKFYLDGDCISTSSVASGQDVIQSSSCTATDENTWQFSNEFPVERVLPVDFVQPTSADWTTIADAAPEESVGNAIFEVCETVSGVQECGGATTTADTAWDATLTSLYDAGVTPLYYISTEYGAVSLSTMETEISNAETWYGAYHIGFMLDEVQGVGTDTTCSGAADCQDYYQDLWDYTDGTGTGDLNAEAVVMLNPGTPPTDNYIFSGDQPGEEIIQVFENSETYWTNGSFSMPSWAADYCTCQFAATISAASASSYQADIQDAEADGVGNVYVENESEPPSYNVLPSFFDAEAAYVAQYEPQYYLGSSPGVP